MPSIDLGSQKELEVLSVFDFETITVSDSAAGKGFTVATFAPTGETPAKAAVVTIDDQPIRVRYDGTAPTTTVGHGHNADDVLWVRGERNIRGFLAIKEGGADATLQVSYLR
jgi:hypothetical protein